MVVLTRMWVVLFIIKIEIVMKMRFLLFCLITFTVFGQIEAQCGGNSHAKKTTHHYNRSHQKDIVETAADADQFSTLVAAVKTAGLVSTLQGDGPFTVFAPVNSAFDKLPEGTVASLLKPENKSTLTKILTYHVVAGEFKAKDVVAAIKASNGNFTIETVSGDKLVASLSGSTVLLTDEKGNVAAVTQTDVDTSNGVIHVIDSVVIPK